MLVIQLFSKILQLGDYSPVFQAILMCTASFSVGLDLRKILFALKRHRYA